MMDDVRVSVPLEVVVDANAHHRVVRDAPSDFRGPGSRPNAEDSYA